MTMYGSTSLPYIAEAHAVAVPDHHEDRYVCGAQIRPKMIKGGASREVMTLAQLHTDLAAVLLLHTLPYLLRVLKDDETIPYMVSQRPIMCEIREKFFGVTGHLDDEKPSLGEEVWPARISDMHQHFPADLV